jgi:hypothetical protein
MTFSNPRGVLLLALLATPFAWAGLGESEGVINGERMRMRAFHLVERAPQYAVHELKSSDGSRVTQYVGVNGLIFAVSWHTLYKPDLSSMLGNSFSTYTRAARIAARNGGIQRQFLHQGDDLVMQNSGRLNVYSGFAYRPSLLPRGLNPQTIGLG